MNLINGRLMADKIKDQIAQEVFQLCGQTPVRPGLAIILVGERPDSALYVRLKEKAAKAVGIDTHLYKIEASAQEQELLDAIQFLNHDDTVNGILIQLPLPENLDTDKIVNSIDVAKDVDGFTAGNLAQLSQGAVVSPVFQSVLACLQATGGELNNKTAAIVAKPGIFTDSLDKLLEHLGAQAITLMPDQVGAATASADIVISAVGQADLISAADIKDGAILIDVGIAKNDNGQTCGDVDAESVASKAAWLTPVPGGIGPLTIAFALKNTLDFFKLKIKNDLKFKI